MVSPSDWKIEREWDAQTFCVNARLNSLGLSAPPFSLSGIVWVNLFMALFGTDGIRALAGKPPLNPEKLKAIGYACGKLLLAKSGSASRNKEILIGRDTRESGPWIEAALSEGFCASGCAVISCGVIPTAAISALLKQGRYLGGSVISASHNPPEYNGVKFFTSTGYKFSQAWEREVEENLGTASQFYFQLAFAKIFSCLRTRLGGRQGSNMRRQRNNLEKIFAHSRSDENKIETLFLNSPKDIYLEFLKSCYAPAFSMRGKRWVVDCANGSASEVAQEVFGSLGAELVALENKPNGKNINAGCGALHLGLLKETVLKEKAWGGCAFDGDADRVLFVDEKGEILDGDLLIAIAAENLKEKGLLKKNLVVATVMANFGFFKWMKKAGITVLTTPVGDRSVSEKMVEAGASLGGEQSGHIIFADYLPTGDGLLTALKILEILVEKGKPISYYRQIYPKTPQVLVNLKVKEKIPVEQIPPLAQLIQNCERDLGEDGRLLVRYSGTEPLLRIMVEGSSLEEIQMMANSIKKSAEGVLL